MAQMNEPSNPNPRGLPAGSAAPARLPQITSLSTAFPMELEGDAQVSKAPHRMGGDQGREPRRHPSGH